MPLFAPPLDDVPDRRDRRRRRTRPRLSPLALALPARHSGWPAARTPVLHSSVDVPSGYAAAAPTETEPEVAWWEGYGDPVLSDLIRRAARENRDVKIAAAARQAARAGVTISRSALLPNVGATGRRPALQQPATARAARPALSGHQVAQRRRRRFVGDRSFRAACARATQAAAADALAAEHGVRGVRLLVHDRRRDQLLHAGRRAAPARDRARDRGGPGRDAAPRHRAPARRPRDARSTSSARRPTRRERTRRSRRSRRWPRSSRHRIAVLIGDQAVQRCEHRPVDGRARRSARTPRATGRAARAPARPARAEVAARRRQLRAGSRRKAE